MRSNLILKAAISWRGLKEIRIHTVRADINKTYINIVNELIAVLCLGCSSNFRFLRKKGAEGNNEIMVLKLFISHAHTRARKTDIFQGSIDIRVKNEPTVFLFSFPKCVLNKFANDN